MLTGTFANTLDEKGRISFPSKLRTELEKMSSQNNVLVVTQGLERCLMLFTVDEWTSLTSKIMESASLFNEQKRLVLRRFIAPAQEVEFDKTGRLSIPQSLREYASLKGECTILAINRYMELWNSESYSSYLEQAEDTFKLAAESMGDVFL